MSIRFKILGKPGRDNALFLEINAGKKFSRILFDCGEDVLKNIRQREVKSIDLLMFSHLHIDHIAGFDYFFRRNYDLNKNIILYGPEGSANIIHNRLRGFTWNLIEGLNGEWLINEIHSKVIRAFRFKASEGFSDKHLTEELPLSQPLINNNYFSVSALHLNHRITSIGYLVSEPVSKNISKDKLSALNIPEGKWIAQLKNEKIKDDEVITVENNNFNVGDLRKELITYSEGDSIAYLTDFIYDEDTKGLIADRLKGCKTIICECQYMKNDRELAQKNYHLFTHQAAEIAAISGTEKLFLFHISDRYRVNEYPMLLKEAREIFPESYFPDEWKIE